VTEAPPEITELLANWSAGDQEAFRLVVPMLYGSLSSSGSAACRIIELRFFGGLSIEETPEVLGLAPATVKNATGPRPELGL